MFAGVSGIGCGDVVGMTVSTSAVVSNDLGSTPIYKKAINDCI